MFVEFWQTLNELWTTLHSATKWKTFLILFPLRNLSSSLWLKSRASFQQRRVLNWETNELASKIFMMRNWFLRVHLMEIDCVSAFRIKLALKFEALEANEWNLMHKTCWLLIIWRREMPSASINIKIGRLKVKSEPNSLSPHSSSIENVIPSN